MGQLALNLHVGRPRRYRRLRWEPGIPLLDEPPPEQDTTPPPRRCWCRRRPDDLDPEVDGAMRWRPDVPAEHGRRRPRSLI